MDDHKNSLITITVFALMMFGCTTPTQTPFIPEPPPPEKIVENYCQTLNLHNYSEAWNKLPDLFKQRKTGLDYGSYVEWWESATPLACSIEDTERFDPYEANIDTLFQYGKGGSNRLRFNLVLNEFNNTWSINDIGAPRVLKTDGVHIRTGPGTDYAINHKGANGNRVWIYQSQKDIDDYDWYKVEVDNLPYEGWVRGDMLTYP